MNENVLRLMELYKVLEVDQKMITEFEDDFISLINKHHSILSQTRSKKPVSEVDFVYTAVCKKAI